MAFVLKLDRDLDDAVGILALRRRVSKTQIVKDALRVYLQETVVGKDESE